MFSYLNLLATHLGLRSVAKDRRGATALEYGLIAALIAVVIIGALTTLGTDLGALFTGISGKITGNTPS
ncbi:Flp family type IVb pilin (plasmid) [Geminicoccaceae bacterium 1502E]|uniref:Flp family type IVb pilin n=1 Tax=Marinimicrococcus flavescens TaxID=3031815 RepID=A0AAP3XPB7_9PROT|nr:Flp family type IVb pilin [Marinimicrococcus flavescens]MDX6750126.1 Flp family type IVb pilin [Geminicoccaceae bacterium 1502E]